MNDEVTLIGAYEAKTNLSAILDKVEQGQEYIITRHGKEIARLSPEAKKAKPDLDELMRRSRELAERTTLGGISWKELRDEGRR